MSTLFWLLIYDALLIASGATIVWSAKSLKKQFAGDIAVVKLLGTGALLLASSTTILYVSGVMTLASTR